METTIRRWLARLAFAVLVAMAMLVLGPRHTAARACPDPSPGTCPPLWDGPAHVVGTCSYWCVQMGYSDGGGCISGCCVCFE